MRIAIVGSGPAALMTADVVSGSVLAAGNPSKHTVVIFEKRKGLGRKLLIAGSSGLNITNSLPLDEFIKHYSGPSEFWHSLLNDFKPADWVRFIESELGIGTFEGTSGRYFVEEMKASKLLQAWNQRLTQRGVEFAIEHELQGLKSHANEIGLRFGNGETEGFDAVCLALGGGSYEPNETHLRWPSLFRENKIGFTEFRPSNVGYHVDWSEAFLKEAEGLPIKNISLTSSRGTRVGEIMVTKYGLEGTPVYFVGETGQVRLDLKRDLDVSQILTKLHAVKENLSPIRRIKKQLNLGPAALALIFHYTPEAILKDPGMKKLAGRIKNFPLTLLQPRPLSESISSAGGVHLGELDESLMLKKLPGVFCAGEMLDWDVPTGGFLIQGAVSQGFRAGRGVLRFLGFPKEGSDL